jgi:hypothetical protein
MLNRICKWLVRVVAIFAIVAGLYLLSVGPVIAWTCKKGLCNANVEAFYKPVTWLHDKLACGDVINGYIGVCSSVLE